MRLTNLLAGLAALSFLAACGDNPPEIGLQGDSVDITVLSAEDEAYVTGLADQIFDTDSSASLAELGIDLSCSIGLELNAVGAETLREGGVTAENLEETYQQVIEANSDSEAIFEDVIDSCVDEQAALQYWVDAAGGEVNRAAVECLVEENGGVSEMLRLGRESDEGSTELQEAVAGSTCISN
jgi:hypothetical protein